MRKIWDKLSATMQVLITVSLLIGFSLAQMVVAAPAPVVIVDQNGSAITNIASVVNNKLATYDAGYLNQIREGSIPGHTFVRVEGNNPVVGTALVELSALSTAHPGNWPAAEGVITLTSSSALDTTGGTGALTVICRGLDSTFTPLTQVVTMQGLDSVYTIDSFFRLNEMEVVTAGTGLANAGVITADIGGADIIAMQVAHAKTSEGRYTVPADKTLYLQDAEGSVIGTNKNSTFHVFIRDTQTAGAPFVQQQIWQSQNGGYRVDGKIMSIAEKYDVIISVQGTAASNDSAGSLQGWIEE